MSKARQLADLGNQVDDGAITGSNMVINGAMTISQRGTSTAITSSSVYTLDRFEARLGGSYTVGATVTQESDGPDGFANCLKVDVTSTSTPATSNNFLIDYKPESQDMVHLNWGSSNGKYLTLSFWVKSNKTGLYGLAILHHGKTRNWLSSYSISAADTWEYKTILIDPDTSSTFDDDNEMSLRINWHLSDGPDDLATAHSWETSGSYQSVTGAVNLCDSTSNYWQITGVCLNVGDSAIDFPHESYGETLARCQRYYHRHVGAGDNEGIMVGMKYNNGHVYGAYQYPVKMRAAPSFNSSGSTDFFYLYATAAASPTSLSAGQVSNQSAGIVFGAAHGSNGDAVQLRSNVAGQWFAFDAEL